MGTSPPCPSGPGGTMSLSKLHLCRRSKTASTTGLWTFREDFSEAEASVEGITGKVREALASDEDEIILTDSQGNTILDSDGTRSKFCHWYHW
ncbi:unnamed protein product [Merluccius merluccius]